MPTEQEISLNQQIPSLAIIAGSGTLPRDLYQRCKTLGIECHIVGFKGHTNYITPDFWGNIGKASQIVKYLKQHHVEHMVFIGGINKPNIWSLRPDWFALKFFLKTWIRSFGDSNVLSAARKEMESLGFHMHGIHQFLPELLMPAGVLGNVQADNTPHDDIILGMTEARKWGEKDKGQAVIVKDGIVIAREKVSGTNRMIERHGAENAILVKMCKPQQDPDMDLPTIGPKTVQLCAEKRMAGIIGQAGHMLIAEQDKVISFANQSGLFILGQDVDEP